MSGYCIYIVQLSMFSGIIKSCMTIQLVSLRIQFQTHMYMHTLTHGHTHVHTHRAHTHTHTDLLGNTQTHLYTFTYTCTLYTQICTHTHTHKHTHTHTQIYTQLIAYPKKPKDVVLFFSHSKSRSAARECITKQPEAKSACKCVNIFLYARIS